MLKFNEFSAGEAELSSQSMARKTIKGFAQKHKEKT
jgi:hypothetical protein